MITLIKTYLKSSEHDEDFDTEDLKKYFVETLGAKRNLSNDYIIEPFDIICLIKKLNDGRAEFPPSIKTNEDKDKFIKLLQDATESHDDVYFQFDN